MGIFKDNLNLDLQYAFLIYLGFKYEESNGINGMSGYVKSINHNKIEVLWIKVNPQERKVHLYNEWDCGGELWHKVFDKNGFEVKLKHCTHKQIEKWFVDNSSNENFKIESVWQPSKDGLGYWFVLEWLNVYGNLKIGIPNRNYYMGKYCMEGNRKYLEENYKK